MEEQKELLNKINDEVNSIVDNKMKANDEQLKSLDDKVKILKNYDDAELKAELIELSAKLEAMKEQSKKDEPVTFSSEIKSKKEDLKNTLKGLKDETIIKANVTRASIADNESSFHLPDIGQLAHRKLTAYDLFPKFRVSDSDNRGVVSYLDWDEATKVRAAAMRTEGVAFPESTAALVYKTVPLEKIGDTLPVTEEFFEDEEMAAAELEMFLKTNVEIVRDTQIVTGDGTPPNLTGLYTSAPEYVAVASGISDASIYDLIVKMKESIVETGGSKYNPDFAMMNIADINKMKLKKDANENYVMPPFVDRAGNVVDGLVIIENNSLAANTMVVGDRRFARIYEKSGVSVQRGYINAQFGADLMTLKVRERLLFLIREADKSGFAKETSISAALTTLATP